jgi:hypothetical protein
MLGTDPLAGEVITPDHVAIAQRVHERGHAQMASLRVWPELDDVTFGSADELARQLDRFVANDRERRETARRMRAQMLDVFGHASLMRRLCAWMIDALAPPE